MPAPTDHRPNEAARTSTTLVLVTPAGHAQEDLRAEIGRLAGDLVLRHVEMVPGTTSGRAFDRWVCTFVRRDEQPVPAESALALLARLTEAGFEADEFVEPALALRRAS